VSAVSTVLAHRGAYRTDAAADARGGPARAHLEAASDALSMALLTLAGEDDDRGDKYLRAATARGFLAEALTALSRARIYLTGIRTHSLPVLMSTESDPDAELQRLHQIATRLLWHNHMHLPARLQADPLAPEEEAQLAVVLAGLARNARIGRALRHKWVGLAVAVAGVGPLVGLPLLGFGAGVVTVGLALWHLAKDTPRRAPSPA
jgi:hypothetical protein